MFKNWNEKHFTILYTVSTIVLIYIINMFPIPQLQILGSSAQSVALWLLSNAGMIYFLNGTGYNIHTEIAKEHNVALGLMIGLYSIGIAIVIHG